MNQKPDLTFRLATESDVETIVFMLADDPLGKKRERAELPLPRSYVDAFLAIDSDPNNELVVAQSEGKLVGFLQLTLIPYLTYQGGWRALVEGVRVAPGCRGQGIGKSLLQWAIIRAKEKGCHLIQLTTDKTREDAKIFYENLGFKATHEGMKLHF